MHLMRAAVTSAVASTAVAVVYPSTLKSAAAVITTFSTSSIPPHDAGSASAGNVSYPTGYSPHSSSHSIDMFARTTSAPSERMVTQLTLASSAARASGTTTSFYEYTQSVIQQPVPSISNSSTVETSLPRTVTTSPAGSCAAPLSIQPTFSALLAPAPYHAAIASTPRPR